MPHRPAREHAALEEAAKLIARLQWYIATSGDTPARAAKCIGVTRATLYLWLLGQRSPDSESRVKIRRFLDRSDIVPNATRRFDRK